MNKFPHSMYSRPRPPVQPATKALVLCSIRVWDCAGTGSVGPIVVVVTPKGSVMLRSSRLVTELDVHAPNGNTAKYVGQEIPGCPTRAPPECDRVLDLHRGAASQRYPIGGGDAWSVNLTGRIDDFKGVGTAGRSSKPIKVYPVQAITRKSFRDMTRKLSVTESHRLAQFRGTLSRKKSSVASAN